MIIETSCNLYAPASMAWQATLDSYDGAPDAGPQYAGRCATEIEAITDLLEQMEDAE